ncbi:MAG: hypothetical protein PHG66_05950 [Candidatus Colwellbacteria bacterium]|nr:hypothetical protein [Candidatus Colwellbacteria bacterium]
MVRKDFPLIPSLRGGIPCLFERGGGYYDSGEAMIITNWLAKKPKAIYISRSPVPCGEHALIPVRGGYFIIETAYDKRGSWVRIWRVAELVDSIAVCELIQERTNDDWSPMFAEVNEETSANLNDAISAAQNKSYDYNCRTVYWADGPQHIDKETKEAE